MENGGPSDTWDAQWETYYRRLFEVGQAFFGKIREIDSEAWEAVRQIPDEEMNFTLTEHPLRIQNYAGEEPPSEIITIERMTIYVGSEDDDFWETLRTLAPLLSTAADAAGIDEVVAIHMRDDAALKLVRHEKDTETSFGREQPREILMEAVAQLRERRDPNAKVRETARGFDMNEMEQKVFGALSEMDLFFTPQCRVVHQGRFVCRVDFMVYFGGKAYAIELDGQQWHSSREARTRDTARTNLLLAKGITTIRFTGSQIHADLRGCMFQLVDCLTGEKGWRLKGPAEG